MNIFSARVMDKYLEIDEGDKVGSLVNPDNLGEEEMGQDIQLSSRYDESNIGQDIQLSSRYDESNIGQDISLTILQPMPSISLSSFQQNEKISIVQYENPNEKETQTVVSCVQPNTRLAIDYNIGNVTPQKLAQERQYMGPLDYMEQLTKMDSWLLPPLDYDSYNREEKRRWFFDSGKNNNQTKMENIRKYRKEGKTSNFSHQHFSCAEALLTLISIINFQQITIEEIAKDNAELAGLIDKYNPNLKRLNELMSRIIKDSDKSTLRCVNNQITKFTWRLLKEEIDDANLTHIRPGYLSSTEYQNKVRKNLLKCRDYLDGCYSHNVNKNRRIYSEMTRIFNLIDEIPYQYRNDQSSITLSSDDETTQE